MIPNTLATWCEELTHWKRPSCWERLKAGGEGDDRGWDGWMASPTQWTWVWASSRRWWWTGKPGVLQSMGLQSWTWLSDWTELIPRRIQESAESYPGGTIPELSHWSSYMWIPSPWITDIAASGTSSSIVSENFLSPLSSGKQNVSWYFPSSEFMSLVNVNTSWKLSPILASWMWGRLRNLVLWFFRMLQI